MEVQIYQLTIFLQNGATFFLLYDSKEKALEEYNRLKNVLFNISFKDSLLAMEDLRRSYVFRLCEIQSAALDLQPLQPIATGENLCNPNTTNKMN